jgi:hypothetical protein
MDRTTLSQAKTALSKALDAGRVVIRSHATADKGGLRRYTETQILAELEVASRSGDIGTNLAAPGRFLAYGIELVISFVVAAPDIVVVTVFEQGG